MNALQKLAAKFREEAETQRTRYHDVRAAGMCEAHALEVEQAEREYALEELSLPQAVLESGYTANHLRNLVKAGKLKNVGRDFKPKYRRGDLPRKEARADLVNELAPARRPGPKPQRCA